MKGQESTHGIRILFSENELTTLNYLSSKLNMSVPEVVRSLVPNLRLPPVTDSRPAETPVEASLLQGPYRIREGYDTARLSEICEELRKNRKAKTLADEIKAQLIDEKHERETLNVTTEKRLIRWAHPGRVDDRTRFAKPRAREICAILFGFVPERAD
jgi:hypothetical protein